MLNFKTIETLKPNSVNIIKQNWLKQKKKIILSYNAHYHLFNYHSSEQKTISFVSSLKAAIKKLRWLQ